MDKQRERILVALVAVVAVAAGGVQDANGIDYKPLFTAAVDDNWHVANNWHDGEVPPDGASTLVGCPAYPDKSVVVYSGQTCANTTIYVGHGDTGSLTIQAGGTFTGWGNLRVGCHDPFFEANWVTVPVADHNDWLYGCNGTAVINGTVRTNGDLTLAGWKPDARAKLYLNSGGIIDMTGSGTDAFLGAQYQGYGGASGGLYGGHWEIHQASGTTLSIPDHILMTSRDGNAFWKSTGGIVRYAMGPGVNWGMFRIFNGIFWVAGGTTTVSNGGTGSFGNDMVFTNQYGTGPATKTPTLKVSGMDPLLKVEGRLCFSGAFLDVSELTITPNLWITVAEANEIGQHTDPQWNPGTVYEGDDLQFASGTDGNLWSLRVDHLGNNKVQVMYIPEPAVLTLLGLGMLKLIGRARRK